MQPREASWAGLRRIGPGLTSFWSGGERAQRVSYVVGALLVVSGLAHLALLTMGGGSWEGPLSLRKATTFGLSFGVTLTTITWVTSFLRLRQRARALLLAAFAAASVFETALVSLQVWRGVPSHFNTETTFDALIASLLAGGGAVLVAVIVVLTIAAFRAKRNTTQSLLLAIRVGFVTLVGAMAVGGLMIARGMTFVVAGEPARAYATGGWFRPAHAVTMHAILVLPALAWLASFTDWSESRRVRVVAAGAVSYGLLATVIVIGNLAGLDLMSPPILATAGACLVSLLGTIIVTIAGVARVR
jgi:hypothetical protein